ncbi:hypothetical protein GA0115254_11583 [Streptomyces sp. Ncost-T10-10d]|nr:hypothetical protein GA0115254_11583 [Streptomyces sp. Ncost-T10-10d]
MGQQLIGGKVHVGESVHRGAEPAHGRCGADAVSDDIADDQGDPGAGQRDHVEPVAPDTVLGVRREVRGRHVQGHASGQRVREQAALQCERSGVLAGVAAGVVHAHRRPRHQVAGRKHVVRLKGGRVQRSHEGGQAEHCVPGPHGNRNEGVETEVADGRFPGGLFDRPQVPDGIENRDEDGFAVAEEPYVVGRGKGIHLVPDPVDRFRAALPHRAHPCPTHRRPQRRATGAGCSARTGRRCAQRPWAGLLGAGDRLQQIDGDEVGEPRHREVGQLLSRAHHVQGGADAGPGVVDQGQTLLGLPPVGDVQDHVADAGDGAVGVGQGEERRGVGALAVRIGPAPAPVLEVDDGNPGVQHAAHQRLYGVGLQSREHFAHPAAHALLTRDAADAFQGFVHPDVAQLRAHHRHADRRAGQEGVEHRLPDRPHRSPFACGDQEALPAVQVERGRDPQIHLDLPTVAPPHVGDTAPPHARTAPLGDPRHSHRVLGHREEEAGGPPDHLGGAVPQQVLCAVCPADDRSGSGHHRGRVIRRVEGVLRGPGLRRFGSGRRLRAFGRHTGHHPSAPFPSMIPPPPLRCERPPPWTGRAGCCRAAFRGGVPGV